MIAIKDREMPKNCDRCFIKPGYCPAIIKRMKSDVPGYTWIPANYRHEDCPLIEVPEPHGRLIDADAMLMRINHEVMEAYMDGVCYGVHPSQEYLYLLGEIIDDTPTVIPASKEEVDEAQRDYQAAADYQQYCETYEQTYDPETGAM